MSALRKHCDYKDSANNYSEANKVQVKYGEKLAIWLGVKEGDKVLDMGCGTGEITAVMADKVGKGGRVVGVDPDQERINIAVRKHCGDERKIDFMLGDSSSRFPHFNDGYYDIHFSNFVFLWLNAQEKEAFVATAFKCLKLGGRIAIQSLEKCPNIITDLESELLPEDKAHHHFVTKLVTESFLKKFGFVILSSEYVDYHHTFPCLDDFVIWCCATDYVDKSKISAHKKEAFARKFVNQDGTVEYVGQTAYRIIAKKM